MEAPGDADVDGKLGIKVLARFIRRLQGLEFQSSSEPGLRDLRQQCRDLRPVRKPAPHGTEGFPHFCELPPVGPQVGGLSLFEFERVAQARFFLLGGPQAPPPHRRSISIAFARPGHSPICSRSNSVSWWGSTAGSRAGCAQVASASLPVTASCSERSRKRLNPAPVLSLCSSKQQCGSSDPLGCLDVAHEGGNLGIGAGTSFQDHGASVLVDPGQMDASGTPATSSSKRWTSSGRLICSRWMTRIFPSSRSLAFSRSRISRICPSSRPISLRRNQISVLLAGNQYLQMLMQYQTEDQGHHQSCRRNDGELASAPLSFDLTPR